MFRKLALLTAILAGLLVSTTAAQQVRYIPTLRVDELQVETSAVTITYQAGDTNGADCTGACSDASICLDGDGDGSTNCTGSSECFFAVCEGSSWVYQTAGGAGGDNVSVNGAAATNPDLRSDGDITVTLCSDAGVPIAACPAADDVVFTIANDTIGEAMLNVIDSPSDGECLTYDSGTGNFEWATCGTGGGLANVVEDSSPQLGNNLDAQGFNITDVGVLTTDTHPVYDAKAYGVVCDGSTDDNAAIQALIDTVEALVTEAPAGSQLTDAPFAKILFPAGDCVLDSALEIQASGIQLVGAGKDSTYFVMREGTQAFDIDLDGLGTTRIFDISLRDFSISYDDEHHTINTAPSADTAAVYIALPRKLHIENVRVEFNLHNQVAGLTGFQIDGAEPFSIINAEVHNPSGTTSGNHAIGLELTNSTDHRGNGLVENFFCKDCQVGVRINNSNTFNNVQFNNLKVVNIDGDNGGAVSRDYKYGVYATDAAGLTFINPMIEGETGGSGLSFEKCFWFEGSAGRLDALTVQNAAVSRCQVGFDLDNVHDAEISNTFAITGTLSTDFNSMFDVDNSSEQVRIVGLQSIGDIITDVLTDASSSTSNNYFQWYAVAATSAADEDRSAIFKDLLRVEAIGVGIGQSAKLDWEEGGDATIQMDVDGGGAEYEFGAGKLLMDTDADGAMDYIYCGDYDGDSDYDDVDIQACVAACTDTDGCTIQLAAEEYNLDADGDGVGDTGCSNPRNPHVCLPSNFWLKGQGIGVTTLKTPAYANGTCTGSGTPWACCTGSGTGDCENDPMGEAPFIAWDNDGDTDVLPTTRSSNIQVTDMTLDGRGSCDPDSQLAQGIQNGDCDYCRIERLEIKHTSHAAIFTNRGTNNTIRDVWAFDVGGYDTDGAGSSCVPSNSQPAFYHYNSTGIRSKDNIYENVYVDQVGGPGGQIRVRNWIQRDAPFGESDIPLDAASQQLAQIFTAGDGTYGSRISDVFLRLRWKGDTEPTGNLTIDIQTTSGGTPTGTTAGSYSFATFDVDDILNDYVWLRFPNTETTPSLIADATVTGLVISWDNATSYMTDETLCLGAGDPAACCTGAGTGSGCTDTPLYIEGDDNATDTYTGGDVYYYDGTSWNVQTGIDLNFVLAEGLHERVGFDGLHVTDVSGAAGNGSQCANMRAGAVSPFFRNISCEDTGPINLAQNNLVLNAAVSNFDFRDAFGSSSNGQAFRIGSWWDGVIEGGNIANTTTSGSPCIEIVDWARNVSLNEINASLCGSYGIRVGGGSRNIRMTDVAINGTEAEGIYLANVADSDGVSGAPDGVVFDRGRVAGTGLECVGLDSGDNASNIRLTNSEFIRCGLPIVELGANGTGDMVLSNFEFSRNYAEDWGNNETTTSANSIGIDIRPATSSNITGIVISDNVFRGKDRPIYLTYSAGTFDQVRITNNTSVGTESQFITFTGASGMEAIVEGNMSVGGSYDISDPNMHSRRIDFPTGEIRWGPGNTVPDVGILRSAANTFGIDTDVDGTADWVFGTTLTSPAAATPGFDFYDSASSSVIAGSITLNMTDATGSSEDTDFTLSTKVNGSDEDFLVADASLAKVTLGSANVDAIVGTVCTAAAAATIDVTGCSLVQLTSETADTTTINTCDANHQGKVVHFITDPGGTTGYGQFLQTGNLQLDGDWAAADGTGCTALDDPQDCCTGSGTGTCLTENDTLSIVCLGTTWYELSRSGN